MEDYFMGVLTREEILKEISKGSIEIEPFQKDQVGPGSIDLHLGNEFRVFKKLRNACVVEDSISVEDLTERLMAEESFTLMPGEPVLGVTHERIKFPPILWGGFEERSR